MSSDLPVIDTAGVRLAALRGVLLYLDNILVHAVTVGLGAGYIMAHRNRLTYYLRALEAYIRSVARGGSDESSSVQIKTDCKQ